MTASPVNPAHLDRLRCVIRAVIGIDMSAASVIRVCDTSSCVKCSSLGSIRSNTTEGRIVHS